MPSIKPSINLDQWANGGAPDLPVTSGSQADKWQNGNLGASQAHYQEGETVPYRSVLSTLKEGTTYWVTIEWDTTKSGVHALDYLKTWNASFPLGRNETLPVPTTGVTDPLSSLGLSTAFNIPADPNVPFQTSGQFNLFGGATFLNFALPGADGKFGTADDINNPGNPYTVSGSYAGDSSTSLTVKFVYTGDGDAVANEIGSAVLAWGGHISTRVDWGAGNSAVAISGSPYHMRLTSFVDSDPNTSESVGQQDRSLASAAVLFPGSITVIKQTTPDQSGQNFNFELTRPANTVDVLSDGTNAGSGLIDLSGDGAISGDDTGRFTDSDGEVYQVTSGGGITLLSGSGDGKINGRSIVGGKLDVDNSGSITTADRFTNLTGVAVVSFTLSDGASKTFANLDLGSGYVVKEIVPSLWDLTSIDRTRTDMNGTVTNSTVANPAGDSTSFAIAEADQWSLTFNDAFLGAPAIDLVKSNEGIVDGDGNGADAGDTVKYNFSVQNTGNIPLLDVSLSDDILGAVTLTGLTDADSDGAADDLAVGATATGTKTGTLTQAQVDAGLVTNIGTASGTGTNGQAVTDTDTNTVTIPVDPELTVVKTNGGVVDGDGNGDDAGDTIVYNYSVQNTGNVTLFDVTLSDDLLGAITLTGLTDQDADGAADDLAVGASVTGSATGTLTQAQINAGSVTNIATGSGKDPDGQPVTDTDTNTVPIDQDAEITVVKSNEGIVDGDANGDDAGDTVKYNFSVTNTGNVILYDVTLNDDVLGAVTLTGLTDLDGDTFADDLAVGATVTGTKTGTLTQAQVNAGEVTNVATAAGNDPQGQPVSDTDTNTVPIDQDPELTVVKTNGGVVDGDANGDDAGDTIVYNYSVQNTGNVTLFDVTLSDDLLGAITLTGLTDLDSDGMADDLAVAATVTGTATGTLTQAQVDAGSVTNIATGNGKDPDGQTVTDTDTNTVPVDQDPEITVVKTNEGIVDGDGNGDDAGDTVKYNFSVTNTGNVTLYDVTLTDDILGSVTLTGLTDLDGDTFADDLAVGATVTGTKTGTLTQAQVDDGGVTNIATASGTDPNQQPVTDTDTNTVPIDQDPELTVVKTNGGVVDGDGNGHDAGDTIVYSYSVQNTGNVTLFDVGLTDDLLGAITLTGLTDLDSDGMADDLAVGATVTGSATGTLTQAQIDAGSVTNIATGSGTDPDGQPVTDADTNTVPLTQSPAITVVKEVSVDGGVNYFDANTAATAPVLLAGTNPVYRFVVTNTGNTTLTGVTLSDFNTTGNVAVDLNGAAAGNNISIGTLAPGAQYTLSGFTGTFASGIQTDVATASGTFSGQSVTDTDAANYNGFQPITFTGNPQFNFPNNVDKIQPKLQGGSFTINSLAYIYWDFFTSNDDLVQIDTRAGTYSTDYAGLKVSIVKIWSDGGAPGTGADAVYRVYVANETANPISLANNTNIVDYDIVKANLTPSVSTDKGMLDLINADPLIGNFNNFSNIENALTKDATNGFLTNPGAFTNGANRVWASPDEGGTAMGEAGVTYDTLDGNDLVYGRNNSVATVDNLSGSGGNDMLDGRAGVDVLNGGNGNDYLFGSLSGDTIIGGAGNDTLFGSYGFDVLTGGVGADNFILRRGDFDRITDFNLAEGDTITIWLESLDGVGAAGTYNVTYDSSTGILSIDGVPLADLTDGGGLHPASVGIIGTNGATADVFLT